MLNATPLASFFRSQTSAYSFFSKFTVTILLSTCTWVKLHLNTSSGICQATWWQFQSVLRRVCVSCAYLWAYCIKNKVFISSRCWAGVGCSVPSGQSGCVAESGSCLFSVPLEAEVLISVISQQRSVLSTILHLISGAEGQIHLLGSLHCAFFTATVQRLFKVQLSTLKSRTFVQCTDRATFLQHLYQQSAAPHPSQASSRLTKTSSDAAWWGSACWCHYLSSVYAVEIDKCGLRPAIASLSENQIWLQGTTSCVPANVDDVKLSSYSAWLSRLI